MADIGTGGMVERVARAIYERRSKRKDYVWPDDVYPAVRNRCLSDARAAIEAMRDPPEYVLDAMNPSKRYASTVIPEAWNDAIDAALLDRK